MQDSLKSYICIIILIVNKLYKFFYEAVLNNIRVVDWKLCEVLYTFLSMINYDKLFSLQIVNNLLTEKMIEMLLTHWDFLFCTDFNYFLFCAMATN